MNNKKQRLPKWLRSLLGSVPGAAGALIVLAVVR